MHSRLETLNMHMALGLNDVRFIGIVGMGGIGKTTLATVLYDKIRHYFDASSFLQNVNKGSEDDCLINLQRQLLCETLQEKDMNVWNLHIGTHLINTRLKNMKSLIVLDNVEHLYQLEKLVGKLEWFGVGSRIIITTRDEHILQEYGVYHIYKVELLNKKEDVQLFCRKAFKCDYPLKEYKGLINTVLKYVKGHPLAIKVIGSLLFGRSVLEWQSALARLQENPNKEIIEVLRTSFDGLEASEKEIFLDIACFLQGEPEWFVKDMLNNCGYHPNIGIKILIDKSLIDIVRGRVQMHDLLQELGKKIVTEKSPKEPGKWSRLWNYEHLDHILRRNSATEDIEVLALFGPHPRETELKAETLSKMSRLRVLILDGRKISRNLVGLSPEIQFIGWMNYQDAYLPHPFTRAPSLFQLDRLVQLVMPCSSSRQLWKSIRPLNNLRHLHLSFSKNLTKMPDFRGMPNLKSLILAGCTSLTHVDESIGVLSKLEFLYLNDCTSLVSLPSSIFHLPSLQFLYLSCCSNLKNRFVKPTEADSLKMSTFTSPSVQKAVMSPFKFFTKRSKQPSELLLHGSRSLKKLNLAFCNLRELPDAIGWMQSLQALNLRGNKVVTLPSTINKLSRLAYLNLGECKELQYLPELPISTDTNFSGEKLSSDLFPSKLFNLGLRIYNCPKLVQNETQPYTKLALLWLTKLILQKSCHPEGGINIVIPGSDVPKWFNHQNLGHSIRVHLPHNSEWIGVALCAALVSTGDTVCHDAKVHHGPNFVVELCGTQKTMCMWNGRSLIPKSLVTAKSDHLWLFYLSQEMSICKIIQTWEAGKEVEFRVVGKDLKVTKCGARWVSTQDIQELQLLKEQC